MYLKIYYLLFLIQEGQQWKFIQCFINKNCNVLIGVFLWTIFTHLKQEEETEKLIIPNKLQIENSATTW